MSNWDYAQKVPTTAWRSATTTPLEIQLIKKGNDYSLISNSVKEINKYISKTTTKKSVKASLSLVEGGEIDLTQAIIEFHLKNLKQDNYTFILSNKTGESVNLGINN